MRIDQCEMIDIVVETPRYLLSCNQPPHMRNLIIANHISECVFFIYRDQWTAFISYLENHYSALQKARIV